MSKRKEKDLKGEEVKDPSSREPRNKGGFKGRRPRGEHNYPVKKSCMNDPNWYVLNPELLKDVASLSFPQWIGRGFNIPRTGAGLPEPVILCLPYMYMLGASEDGTSGINLAIRNLYTYVRHQNSGHTNYESGDLGMYLLAVAGVVASLAHIERVLGVAKLYQRRSAIVPRALLTALGVSNYNGLIGNLANYTARLNLMWQRVSSLCLPKDFKFIQRWIWMNSQVFKDHESDKAALIVFKPISVPKFYATNTGTGGAIYQFNSEGSTPDIEDWFNDAEDALNRILIDEDMNIMSGDILKAYGKENLMTFGMTPLDYIVEPVYVEEMLPQVQHCQTLIGSDNSGNGISPTKLTTGIPYDVAQILNDQTLGIYAEAQNSDVFIIYQCGGEVVCCGCDAQGTAATIDTTSGTLYWSNNSVQRFIPDSYVLTSYKESPTPEDVMLSTRLMYTNYAETRVSANANFIASCGTEIVTHFKIYSAYFNGNTINIYHEDMVFCPHTSASTGRVSNYNLTLKLGHFDWSPLVYEFDNGPGRFIMLSGDIDNFTILSKDRLNAMHTSAVLAEFSVTSYNLIK